MTDAVDVQDLLDHPLAPGNVTPRLRDEPAPGPPAHRVRLSVAWGNLAQVPADVHLVGHYQGVLPAAAERDLDRVITGRTERGIITEHTRRGWVTGRLGEVSYFPSVDEVVRLAAIAGLGRHGTFNERRAVQLYTSVFTELTLLPGAARAASVLIGAGAGNLTIRQAVAALVDGFADALARCTEPPPLRELVLVEIDRLRAELVLLALRRRIEQRGDVGLDVVEGVRPGQGGELSPYGAAVYGVQALARLLAAGGRGGAEGNGPKGAAAGEGVDRPALLDAMDADVRDLVCDQLPVIAAMAPDEIEELAHGGSDAPGPPGGRPPDGEAEKPVRVSVLSGPDQIKWAALSDYASIPERQVPRTQLFDDLVRRLHHPDERDTQRLSQWLTRMVIPPDFHGVITDQGPLVLELDRRTAPLHWELMTDLKRDEPDRLPLVLRTPISRQLRTGYSRVLIDTIVQSNVRALVIGDPGRDGAALPEARQEAKHVVEVLQSLGVEVVAYIGAPSAKREEDLADIPPASRLEVLGELLSGGFDLVHYSGHGTIDQADPDRAGWVFSEGLITSRELSQLSEAPRIVVANACYSAVVGTAGSASASAERATDPGLTPGLADEFLRAGALHYIGAAWPIPDEAGRVFAEVFYRALLQEGVSVGTALCRARCTVHERADAWGTTWAAYQHYGDPTDHLRTVASEARPEE